MVNLQFFLSNNILTRFFKKLKKYIRMAINNIQIIYVIKQGLVNLCPKGTH